MNIVVTALILSLGAGTWIYTQVQRRVGYGNSKSALKTAAIAGAICFVVVLTVGLTLFG